MKPLAEVMMKLVQGEKQNGSLSGPDSFLRTLVAACVALAVQVEENRAELLRLRREIEKLKWKE